MRAGDTITLKGQKTRAKIVRVYPRRHWTTLNNWEGWVQIDPPLGSYTRWPVDELEFVKR